MAFFDGGVKFFCLSPSKSLFINAIGGCMKYYKTDSRKISYREYWHLSRKGFWLAWLKKLRGVRMNLVRGIPGLQPFLSRVIKPDDMPREILERLARKGWPAEEAADYDPVFDRHLRRAPAPLLTRLVSEGRTLKQWDAARDSQ